MSLIERLVVLCFFYYATYFKLIPFISSVTVWHVPLSVRCFHSIYIYIYMSDSAGTSWSELHSRRSRHRYKSNVNAKLPWLPNQAQCHSDVRGMELQPHAILISAIDGSNCLASRSGRFTTKKEPRYTLDIMLSKSQNRSRHRGDKKTLPCREMKSNRPVFACVN
jgi:hypothetical protein